MQDFPITEAIYKGQSTSNF